MENSLPTKTKIKDLFDISSGNSFEYNRQIEDLSESGVNFVSRTTKNNGISGKVKAVPGAKIFPDGTISVALSGNGVLSSFVQMQPYYTGSHMAILTPKNEMSLEEKLFWCWIIKNNSWKYSFGRQANRTLKDLVIPDKTLDEFMSLFSNKRLVFDINPKLEEVVTLPPLTQWNDFYLSEIFSAKSGDFSGSLNVGDNIYPVVTAGSVNNGITSFGYNEKSSIFSEGSITLAKNGSVGETFYQPKDFYASSDVLVLRNNKDFSKQTLMFISTVIKHQVSNRFHYGYKINDTRFKELLIKLPITQNGDINSLLIDEYMNSLKWSKIFKN